MKYDSDVSIQITSSPKHPEYARIMAYVEEKPMPDSETKNETKNQTKNETKNDTKSESSEVLIHVTLTNKHPEYVRIMALYNEKPQPADRYPRTPADRYPRTRRDLKHV